jgi:IPT/TIG domain
MMFSRKSPMMFLIGPPIVTRPAAFFRKSFLIGLLFLPVLSMSQTFVQENSNAVAASTNSVSVTYTTAETAGNLNIVVVGWSDTSSSVTSVVDDNTNTYVLAGTSAGNGVSQAIYYAPNIVLPTNSTPTITVTFNQPAGFPDIRILEYSGLSTISPLDNWIGNSDVSTLADSGAALTSTTSLILGAGTTATRFTTAGTGFTLRALTGPFSDIVEDSGTSLAVGTYNATAILTNGAWVMQMAAFSTTGVTYASAPAISTTAPGSGPNLGGTTVTITGTNFQPGAVVLFGTAPGGISGVNCTESGGTTITCLTPADSAGVKDITVVNVDGKLGSALAAYTDIDVRPTIVSVTPSPGPTNGSAITITGTNFEAGAKVTIGDLPAGDVVVQDSTTITASTPGLPVGPNDVTVTNPDTGTITSAGGFTYNLGTGPINYIQRGDAVTNLPSTMLPVQMPNQQTAGSLNVVIIGWADITAAVSSVADTEGNNYVAALAPVTSTGLSQVIYYAKNIAGDSGTPNQITVTFSQPAQFPDIRILEYSGLDPNFPLDAGATSGAAGSGSLADSSACTTTTPVELIVAGGTVATHITGAGAGFTILDITHPNGDNAQHQITSVAGSCEATAPMAGGEWVMQSVAFKLTPPPDFTIAASALSPDTILQGDSATSTVTIAPLSAFTGSVALTCSITPVVTPPPTCSFNPTPVTNGSGTSVLTLTAGATTPPGPFNVTVTGTSGSLTHSKALSLTVSGPADFTVAASAFSPGTISAGASGTSTITVTAQNGFNDSVALSCSTITPVVSRAPTCSFNPTAVAGGAGTSTLTVSTTPVTRASIASPSQGIFYALWLPIGGLALLGAGCTSRRRKLLGLFLVCLMVSGLIFMAACGGGSSMGGGGHPGTPAGTYTVTVSATSGSLTHTVPVTVIVQ